MDYDFMDKLYRDTFDKVKMVVTNTIYSRNIDDITSCTHDVFITAMKKEGLENHPNVEGWLYITAKNITLRFNEKYLYRLNKNQDLENLEIPKEDFSHQVDEDMSFEKLGGKIIESVFSSLTALDKDFYELKYKKKLSNEEISEIFGVSVGAILTRNSRLKAKVKTLVKEAMQKNNMI